MVLNGILKISKHGHSGPNRVLFFLDLLKSAPFRLYKNSVRDRFGFYRVRIGVSKSSKKWYNPLYFRVRVPIGSSVLKYLICTYFLTRI